MDSSQAAFLLFKHKGIAHCTKKRARTRSVMNLATKQAMALKICAYLKRRNERLVQLKVIPFKQKIRFDAEFLIWKVKRIWWWELLVRLQQPHEALKVAVAVLMHQLTETIAGAKTRDLTGTRNAERPLVEMVLLSA